MGDRARARRERAAGWAAMREAWPAAMSARRLGAVVAASVVLAAIASAAVAPHLAVDPPWRGQLGVALGALAILSLVAMIALLVVRTRAGRRSPLDVPFVKESIVETALERDLTDHELEYAARIRANRRVVAPYDALGGAVALALGVSIVTSNLLVLGPSYAVLAFIFPVVYGFAGIVGAVRGLGRAELLVADADAADRDA